MHVIRNLLANAGSECPQKTLATIVSVAKSALPSKVNPTHKSAPLSAKSRRNLKRRARRKRCKARKQVPVGQVEGEMLVKATAPECIEMTVQDEIHQADSLVPPQTDVTISLDDHSMSHERSAPSIDMEI